MDWKFKVLDILSDPNIAYILLLIGLAGLYFEFSTPGVILPGVIGGISLIMAFFAMQTLPVNYAGVGLIVFAVLTLINFVVITKGSERVAEVSARFSLDAMPGKQLAIDAELNAGVINEVEARTRRRKVEEEADFYGAMDGASKPPGMGSRRFRA